MIQSYLDTDRLDPEDVLSPANRHKVKLLLGGEKADFMYMKNLLAVQEYFKACHPEKELIDWSYQDHYVHMHYMLQIKEN